MTIVQIIGEQWDWIMEGFRLNAAMEVHISNMEVYMQSLEAYIKNQFVFVIWATLALFFIMAVCFYILFSGRGRK